MASQAEVDLVVNATRTLPELERDLNRVLTAAQADMSDLDVAAVLNQTTTLNQLDRDLDRVIAAARAGADDIDLDAALNQQASIRQVRSDLDRLVNAVDAGGAVDPVLITAALNGPESLRTVRRELDDVIRVAQATAPDIEVEVDIDHDTILRAVSTIGSLGTTVLKLGAAAGTAAPLLAGVAGAVQNIIPAAAVATQGILAMQLATQTLKLGFMGVGEAISEAFKPDADAEKVNDLLKELSPNARATAKEIIGMRDSFKNLQLGVQNRLFKDFDEVVKGLSTTALPLVRNALNSTAVSLNAMGIGVAKAAVQLSNDGTLGQALKGATTGIENLRDVPGQAVTAFTQLAAAAAPAFDRITTAVGRVADTVAEKLTSSFKSGGLEDAINGAVDSIAQLGRVAGNIFGGLSNIIKAVSVDGEGLFGTLESLSQQFETLTGTKAFQDGLTSLAETMALLYKTAGPLLGQALIIIANVLTRLADPAQQLITLLGEQFGNILTELSPVLESLATAFGKLVVALLPIIKLAGELITAILPVLVPQFEAFGQVFDALAPVIAQVAGLFAALLLPVLAQLPTLLETILPVFVQLAQEVLPQVADSISQLAPLFAELGVQFGQLIVAAAPLIAEILQLVIAISAKLIPILTEGLVVAIAGITVILAGFAAIFRNVVLPIVNIFISLIRGDFLDSTSKASQAVQDMKDRVVGYIRGLVADAIASLTQWVYGLRDKVNAGKAAFLDGVRSMADQAVNYVSSLPGRLQGALGNLGHILFGAGASLIGGFIDGIQSQVGSIISTLGGITDKLPDWKGPADLDRRILIPTGRMVMEGFMQGVREALPDVQTTFGNITHSLPGMTLSANKEVRGPVNPKISVYIGNELVNSYVAARVEEENRLKTRTTAQGVRF